MNICITCFNLNEPSNSLLYYFYMFYIVFVYFCMHVFLFWFNFKCSQSILNERIFEKNLIPLDLSQLEVFLGSFWEFFIFWIQIWILNWGRFDTGPNRNRSGPVWPVTGQTGPVPTGLVNPAPPQKYYYFSFAEDSYLSSLVECCWLPETTRFGEAPGLRSCSRVGTR